MWCNHYKYHILFWLIFNSILKKVILFQHNYRTEKELGKRYQKDKKQK